MNQNRELTSRSGRTFAVIKDLTAPSRGEIPGTFERLGELLAASGLRGTVQLRLVRHAQEQQSSCFKLKLHAGKATTSTVPAKKPDVELITTPETWSEIATGQLAPHVAFLGGRMRVRGNADLAERMLEHVAASPGRTHLCTGGD